MKPTTELPDLREPIPDDVSVDSCEFRLYCMRKGLRGPCMHCGLLNEEYCPERPGSGVRGTLSNRLVCEYCHQQIQRGDFQPAVRVHAIQIQIPQKYAHATIDLIPSKQRNFILQWPRKKKFIVLGGIAGSGKTFCCHALRKDLASYGIGLDPARGWETCDKLRGIWLALEIHRREALINKLMEVPYLMLDGFTDAQASDAWAECMQRVLDSRWSHQKPLMITTMDSPDAIEKSWGRHILSRINQYPWIVLPAVDRRKAVQDAAD